MDEQTERGRRTDVRAICGWAFVALLVASAVAVRLPVMTTATRVLLVATLGVGLLTALLYLVKFLASRPGSVYPAIFFLGLFVLWAVLAGKSYDVKLMRAVYARRLISFQGTPYIRGGETANGIDCPGLVRVALWQAMFRLGLREVSPHLLGPMLWRFWWTDVSGRDLLHGRHGYTRIIGHAAKLAGLNTRMLEIGDLAITDSGLHALAYLGRGRWIEANPRDGRVVINVAFTNSKRPYFNTPVTFLRWWVLTKP